MDSRLGSLFDVYLFKDSWLWCEICCPEVYFRYIMPYIVVIFLKIWLVLYSFIDYFFNVDYLFIIILKLALLTCLFSVHPFSPPQKTSENLTAFWCFQGVEKECIGNKPCVNYFQKKKRIFHLALRKLFRKTNIQGVRNVNFSGNLAYEINEWSQTFMTYLNTPLV